MFVPPHPSKGKITVGNLSFLNPWDRYSLGIPARWIGIWDGARAGSNLS